MPAGSGRGANRVSSALAGDGFAVVEGALNASDLAVLRDALDPLLRRTPTGRNAFEGRRTKRVYSLLAKTRATDALAASDFLAALAREWIGHHQLSAHIAVEVGAGAPAQVLHSDDGIYPVARPHDDLVLSALWAVDGLAPEAGATVVVPGSQLDARDDGASGRGRSPVEPPGATAVALPAGALLLYRGGLRHGIGANRSPRPVRFVHTEYIASWLRPLETHLLSIPTATARGLPVRLQELIGYNIRPPYTGCVNGRHPRRTLRRFRLTARTG